MPTTTTFAALGFSVSVFPNGTKFTYNHKTKVICMDGSASYNKGRLISYDPDGEWFDIMDTCRFWR
jgi:hypothetical protein